MWKPRWERAITKKKDLSSLDEDCWLTNETKVQNNISDIRTNNSVTVDFYCKCSNMSALIVCHPHATRRLAKKDLNYEIYQVLLHTIFILVLFLKLFCFRRAFLSKPSN